MACTTNLVHSREDAPILCPIKKDEGGVDFSKFTSPAVDCVRMSVLVSILGSHRCLMKCQTRFSAS